MIEMIFIELFGVLTFFYAAMLMLLVVGSGSEMMIVLATTTLVGLCLLALYKRSKWFAVLSLSLCLPIMYFQTPNSAVFFILEWAIFLLYMTSREAIEELEMKFVIKTAFSYLTVSVVVFWFLSSTFNVMSEARLKVIWPFLILFVMSAIMYLRNVRHIDANLEPKKIRRSNIRYVILMIGVYLSILFNDFKEEVGYLIDALESLMGFLLTPIYWLFRNYRLDFGTEKEEVGVFAGEKSEFVRQEAGEVGEAIVDEVVTNDNFMETAIFILSILGILLIMFFVIKKLLKDKTISKDEFTPEVEEVRSFIKKDKKSRFGEFFKNFGSKTLQQQVRSLYRKHLHAIEKEEEILKTETTLEIQIKGDELGFEHTADIREVYCGVRYGNHEPSIEAIKALKDKV